MEGPRAVESALDQCVVTSDRGHDHDPAREPPGTPLEASESEEQCGEDGEGREEPRTLTVREGANKRVVPAPRHEERATPRDPCTSQRNNRGPPVA